MINLEPRSTEFITQGDYDAYVEFSKEDVLNKYHEMNEFIATLEDFLLAE